MDATTPILVVEDNADDLYLLKRLFEAAGIARPVVAVEDGLEAKAYLQMAAEAADPHMVPVLVVTDMKMPRVDGLELTTWVRRHPSLAGMRVIMLSGSRLPNDRARAREAGADVFFAKFPSVEELAAAVRGA